MNRSLAPAPPGLLRVSPDELDPPSRKHATTACAICKRKKLKCQGGHPCHHCRLNALECVKDEARDMRRKGAYKRKCEALEASHDLLLRILDRLRRAEQDSDALRPLLALVRSGADLTEIHRFVDGPLRPSLTTTAMTTMIMAATVVEDSEDSMTVEGEGESLDNPDDENDLTPPPPPRRSMMGVERLSDIPLVRVPARPWTRTTTDDELVSHLVSLWLTWCQPLPALVHRHAFLQTMQTGRPGPFCSPFLVCAILTEASTLCDYEDVLGIPDDVASRGARFYDEARRRLDDEGLELTTAQGLAILSITLTAKGRHRQAWTYLSLARSIADELARRAVHDEAVQYGLTVSLSILQHRPSSPPRISRPTCKTQHGTDADTDTDSWSPYPRRTQPETTPAHLACVFDRSCDLALIASRIGSALLYADPPPSPETAEETADAICQQLQTWYATLPEGLAVVREDSLPHILQLHIQYHISIIQLFHLVKGDRIQQVHAEALSQIVALLRIHRRTWGLERISPTSLYWVCLSLADLIYRNDWSVENQENMTELCIVARACSRRWPLAGGVLRMVQVSARRRRMELSAETKALCMDFEVRVDDAADDSMDLDHPPSREDFLEAFTSGAMRLTR
ncbi:hypothetical protein ASPZODRAFT_19853 [Penicilliopsis zonata CBS 506.65]|uniref:Zn(2)-C6 fungal-type domain-containing protein n=1 Tax=Penicilliopsis zonata CBS 506.65 TaxID=1073090 RepID=A0A1L9S7Q4_9EURO|nr:hypothetical protein ASPZODRAFT_19853 [Penicilliopsis zonata CBS 506.65]OJJ43164.1 hypothetical protein ASPZODRAFT_19853 [Penicilliopsis zonata CBS 506.65]